MATTYPPYVTQYGPQILQGLPYEPFPPTARPPLGAYPMSIPEGAGLTMSDVFRPPRPSMASDPNPFPRMRPVTPRTMGDLGRVQLPRPGSLPSAGEYRAGLRLATQRGPQLPGLTMPGAGLASRGGFFARHPNLARGAGGLGRLGTGALVGAGGAAMSDVIGDNPLGNAVGAGTGAAGYAAILGGAPAAAVGLGLFGGTLTGEALNPGHKLSNVPNNIARRRGGGQTDFAPQVDPETGQVSGALADLEAQGVTVSDLVDWMGDTREVEDGTERDYLATRLAEAGVAGAKYEDGGVVLEGKAMDLVDKLSSGSDDAGIQMIRRLAARGADEGEVGAGFGTYVMAKGQGMSDDEAVAAGLNAVEEERQLRAADEQASAEMMAMQAQAMQYLAPVTGRMRSTADFLYDQIDQLAGPGPEGDLMRQMAAFERAEQHNLADQYEAQIQLAPQQSLMQQYNTMRDSIADQLTQQAISQMIGAGGSADPLAALLGGGAPAGQSPLMGTSGAAVNSPMGTAPAALPQQGGMDVQTMMELLGS